MIGYFYLRGFYWLSSHVCSKKFFNLEVYKKFIVGSQLYGFYGIPVATRLPDRLQFK